MITETDVTVCQIMRHATEYTLPDRLHTTRNQRPAASPGHVVLAGSGNRTVPIIHRPPPVESIWQEGSPKVRVDPALPKASVASVS